MSFTSKRLDPHLSTFRLKTVKIEIASKLAVNIPSVAELKESIDSKKALSELFLKDLLKNIIISQEFAPSREIIDKGMATPSYDEVLTTQGETEGDSKLFLPSVKSSKLSAWSSERTLDKTGTEHDSLYDVRKTSSSVTDRFEKQGLELLTSEEVGEKYDTFSKDVGTWNKFIKLKFSNGNYYEGEVEGCIMHGQGIYVWSDGTIYEGEFKNGFPIGKGKMVLSELSTYSGDFCMGYFHGEGVLNVCSTPIIYKGQWKSGKRHGCGWISYGSDNWYEGQWFEDKKHGNGCRNYRKGVKYEGQWLYNEKHGEGRMLWGNNDYYKGHWSNNTQHGYGEYIWNLTLNNSFMFLIYNSYKGAWVEGKRSGIGLMNFGTATGAKLAGMWVNDRKDGPGILSCGNGEIIACNPLFQKDKPVHKTAVNFSVNTIPEEEKVFSKMVGKNLLRTVVNIINQKKPIYMFDEDILNDIAYFSNNILNSFETYSDQSKKHQIWYPLKISVNVIAEAVNMRYYIADVLAHYKRFFLKKSTMDLKSRHSMYAAEYLVNRSKHVQANHQNEKEIYEKLFKTEERLLSNAITIHLTKLKEIYMLYAKLANTETKTKPVLTRLFLWQLLRDIQIFNSTSLVEADLYFCSNPWSCTESDHNPFEEIYFWQFLQYLVGCSWLFHKYNVCTRTPPDGLLAHIFRTFLEKEVYPSVGKFDGTALREHINTVPITAVHKLYQSLGEPHTIRTFLIHTCTKNKKDPPCYFGRYSDKDETRILEGYNAVSVGSFVNFIPTNVTESSEIPEKNNFRKTLYTFRVLGKKKIIKCIKAVYPNLKDDNVFDMNYKINFLEFYELILLCALEKMQIIKKAELEKKSFAETELTMSLANKKISKRDTARKKTTKSSVSIRKFTNT